MRTQVKRRREVSPAPAHQRKPRTGYTLSCKHLANSVIIESVATRPTSRLLIYEVSVAGLNRLSHNGVVRPNALPDLHIIKVCCTK